MKCPHCKKKIIESCIEDLSCLPFCSKRCKLLDLGAWANEEYVISSSVDETSISLNETNPTQLKKED